MAVQQEATFTGVQMADVRPGSIVDVTTTDAIAKGQAHVYEVLTGIAAPNAAGIVATGHQHDADGNGALIRVPLAQGVLDVAMPGIASTQTGVTPGWQKFLDATFYVPTGFTEVSVVICGKGAFIPFTCRGVVQDELLADNFSPRPFQKVRADHYFNQASATTFEFRAVVVPGEMNTLVLQAWAGKSLPSADDDDDGPFMENLTQEIYSWHVLPVDKAPAVPVLAVDAEPGLQSLDRAVLTTFESTQSAVDEGLDAHFLREASQNDGLLRELCIGRAAGSGTSAHRQLTGHRHADNGASDLDDSGLLVDASLGAWSYGVVRRLAATDTARPSFDEVAASVTVANSWSGKIFAPVLGAVTSSTSVSRHHFRLPATKSSHLTGTSKIKFAVLVWKGDSTSISVTVQLTDYLGLNADLATTVASTATGRVLITGEIDAEIDGGAAATQDDQKARVALSCQAASAKSANFAVYGLALALVAA